MCVSGVLFYFYKDKPDLGRLPVWHKALIHAAKRPITGWGLDSFRRSDLSHKNFTYVNPPHFALARDGKTKILETSSWDNPHNLYISLFYEWGLFGIIILIGYLRFLGLRFKHATKDRELLGLAGFIIALLIVSFAHFPLFLSRMAVFIIPIFSLYELKTR